MGTIQTDEKTSIAFRFQCVRRSVEVHAARAAKSVYAKCDCVSLEFYCDYCYDGVAGFFSVSFVIRLVVVIAK